MVEDTSLYFEVWRGLPGALVRWFLDAVECDGICRMMNREKNRKDQCQTSRWENISSAGIQFLYLRAIQKLLAKWGRKKRTKSQ